MRILLVEDNRSLADWLGRTLRASRYAVDCAYTGRDADHLLLTQDYELVILDLELPGMDGRTVLQRLRARDDETPVLILTANNSLEGRVDGLDAGADDYVAKPFEVDELEARLRALVRRGGPHRNPLIRCGRLAYDSNQRRFSVDGAVVALTPREHAVLEALILRSGRTISKQVLAQSLFAMDNDAGIDAIEVYVHRLRRKIGHSEAEIITLRGLGYLLKPHHEA